MSIFDDGYRGVFEWPSDGGPFIPTAPDGDGDEGDAADDEDELPGGDSPDADGKWPGGGSPGGDAPDGDPPDDGAPGWEAPDGGDSPGSPDWRIFDGGRWGGGDIFGPPVDVPIFTIPDLPSDPDTPDLDEVVEAAAVLIPALWGLEAGAAAAAAELAWLVASGIVVGTGIFGLGMVVFSARRRYCVKISDGISDDDQEARFNFCRSIRGKTRRASEARRLCWELSAEGGLGWQVWCNHAIR